MIKYAMCVIKQNYATKLNNKNWQRELAMKIDNI